MAHFDLGGSSAERWMSCALSYILIRFAKAQKLIPEKKEHSEAADRGTVVHFLNEVFFTKHMEQNQFLGKTFTPERSPFNLEVLDIEHDIDVTERDISSSIVWTDYIQEKLNERRLKYYSIEHKSNLHALYPDLQIGGACDFVTVIADELTIYDYKNGRWGVLVPENSQFLIYALGMYLLLRNKYKIRRIRMVVVQPNANVPGGAIRSDVIRVDQLKKWVRTKLKPAVNRIRNATLWTEPQPSDKACAFCEVKNLCRAHNKDIDVENLLSPHLLTDMEINDLLVDIDYKIKRLTKFKEWSKKKFESGKLKLKDFELIDNYGNRRIKEPDKLKTFLKFKGFSNKDYMTEPKLKPLTDLEKNPRIKALLTDYIDKDYKGLVMAKKEKLDEN